MEKKAKQRGFGLVELMVVVSIVGILATALVYNIRSGRGKSAARGLISDIQRAKMEAVKRNTNVVVTLNAVACPGLAHAIRPPGSVYSFYKDIFVNGAFL